MKIKLGAVRAGSLDQPRWALRRNAAERRAEGLTCRECMRTGRRSESTLGGDSSIFSVCPEKLCTKSVEVTAASCARGAPVAKPSAHLPPPSRIYRRSNNALIIPTLAVSFADRSPWRRERWIFWVGRTSLFSTPMSKWRRWVSTPLHTARGGHMESYKCSLILANNKTFVPTVDMDNTVKKIQYALQLLTLQEMSAAACVSIFK